jgi:hypothetical protein
MFEYSELLDAAAVSSSPEEQLSFVAAFAIGQQDSLLAHLFLIVTVAELDTGSVAF